MGSECRPNKFHYDIAMSKRTRRPSDFKKETAELQECGSAEDQSSEKVANGEKDKHSSGSDHEAQENENKKSLKQLIEGRSLCQHFTEEENQLQLVKQQDQEGLNRLKFKKLVSRYGKVLSHLMKLKRNPETFRKKPILPWTKKTNSSQ